MMAFEVACTALVLTAAVEGEGRSHSVKRKFGGLTAVEEMMAADTGLQSSLLGILWMEIRSYMQWAGSEVAC
jgi:hypothetical protein